MQWLWQQLLPLWLISLRCFDTDVSATGRCREVKAPSPSIQLLLQILFCVSFRNCVLVRLWHYMKYSGAIPLHVQSRKNSKNEEPLVFVSLPHKTRIPPPPKKKKKIVSYNSELQSSTAEAHRRECLAAIIICVVFMLKRTSKLEMQPWRCTYPPGFS